MIDYKTTELQKGLQDFCFCETRASICGPGRPATLNKDQAGPKLTDTYLLLLPSAGIKGRRNLFLLSYYYHHDEGSPKDQTQGFRSWTSTLPTALQSQTWHV